MANAPSSAIDAYSALYDNLILDTRPSSTEADGRLSQIDAELYAINLSVARLRRRRNALTPISRLPIDILALILGLVPLSDPLIDKPPVGARLPRTDQQCRPVLRWVTITHVCSLWRAMTLENSRLWFEVPLRLGIDWANEIIRRRGEGGGLSFEYVYDDHKRHLDADCIVTLLRQNLPFIEQLRVDSVVDRGGKLGDTRTPLLSGLLCALDSPAPQLRALYWHSDRIPQTAWPRWPRTQLFAGQAPQLTIIYLHGHPASRPVFGPAPIVPSLKPLMPQLTHLIMDLKAQSRWDVSSFIRLHGALSVAHRLEHLDVRGLLFQSRNNEAVGSLVPLDFPSMKIFRVIAPLVSSACLTHLVSVPDTCIVEVGCYVHHVGESSTDALRRLSQSLHDRFATITTLELAARRLPDPYIAFSGWSARSWEPLLEDFTQDDGLSPIDAKRPAPDISVTFRECPNCNDGILRDRPDFLAKLLSLLAVPLSGIENLSLRVSDDSGAVTYASPDWSFVRESFQSLRWLRVDRYIASQLLRQQWDLNENILAPSVAHILVIGVEWLPNPSDAHEYEQRKQQLRRLLQVGSDTPDLYPVLRSVTVGGRAGGSHEALVNDMPDVPFTSLQAPVGRAGSPGGEDNLLEMY